ncbi:hypothetical protein BDP27DRAFT_1347601 [Rhodocollybia butyracea]|uniref:Altered inheritance of mitochondria protein 9, mitochondrial n=1 Tax=Rhodocollybia butyracea TaxID=206335 RepID=A0A9P5P7T7_9AGAR|nr:hypothetical protein BDP27DRAFT_1347601 [Rhodocollybia butyracea]
MWRSFRKYFHKVHPGRGIATIPSRSELYQTSFHWLYNDKAQHDIRHVPFDVSALMNIACASVQAQSCTSVIKIAEGCFNKIFRLVFDNEKTIIARIPSARMFGESGISWITASEVATMQYARNINIRTPVVLSWAKDHANPVCSPYMILEDIPGIPLNEEWYEPSTRGTPVGNLLTALANYVGKMHLPPLQAIGSIYFRKDIPPSLARPLFPSSYKGVLDPENQLCIGPIAQQMWWRVYHDEPQLNRGPFDTIEDYFLAAINIERRAVERHSEELSSLKYTRTSASELPGINNLLDKVESLAPYLCRLLTHGYSHPQRLLQPVLDHPDLRAANIIIPSSNGQSNEARMHNPTLIDWQGAAVLPLACQYEVPDVALFNPSIFVNDEPLFRVPWTRTQPAFPDNLAQMSEKEQEAVCAEHRLVCRHIYWINTFKQSPEYVYLDNHPVQGYLSLLVQTILRVCADGPFYLRSALVEIMENWQEADFSAGELESHERDVERQKRYNHHSTWLHSRLRCDMEGSVQVEDWEYAVSELEKAREEWDEPSCGGPFPFVDGAWAQFLR